MFQHEGLRSRLEIREYLLHTIVEDVYENIGQSLSLVRIHLVTPGASETDIKTASNLVGKSIKDLKDMCNRFYEDIELDNLTGWIKMLDYTIQTLSLKPGAPTRVEGKPVNICTGLKLIVARMLQEILISIKNQGLELIQVSIAYSATILKITIDYKGPGFRIKNIHYRVALNKNLWCLNFMEKTSLIRAGISTRIIKKDLYRIIIKVPLTSPLYE